MTITIPGRVPSKGSTVSFRSSNSRRIVTLQDSPTLTLWTHGARRSLLAAGLRPIPAPRSVAVALVVCRTRAKRSTYLEPTMAPDLDKLARAVLDALTGLAFDDDAQVTILNCEKRYGPRDELIVTVQARPASILDLVAQPAYEAL